MFVVHIPLFSIPTSFYNASKSDLIHIDPFTLDTNTVPQTVSQTPSSVSDNVSCRVPIESSADSGAWLLILPLLLLLQQLPAQLPPETAVTPPPLRHSTGSHKFTKLPDFAYS